jgi:hypothetical protein
LVLPFRVLMAGIFSAAVNFIANRVFFAKHPLVR